MASTTPTAPASPAGTGPTPDEEAVRVAFSLGWGMVDLYREGLPRQTQFPTPGKRLPGVGRLTPSQRALLRLDQVDAAVSRLSKQIDAGGLHPPSTRALRTIKEDPDADSKQRKAAIYTLHVELLRTLTAADFRLGKAYGLGRALADCCQTAADLDTLVEHFGRYRLDVLRTWLNDAASYLPEHSAKAVLAGLSRWEAWVANARPQLTDPDAWEQHAELLAATLRRQGEIWRAMLSGEKNARDTLTADSYQKAAAALIHRGYTLARPFLIKYGLALVFAILLVGVLAWAVLSNGTSQILTTIGALATALGITWTTVGGTAQKLGETLERPLWGAELDAAVSEAITYLPLQPVAEPRPDLLLDTPLYLRAVDVAQSPTAAQLELVLSNRRGAAGQKLTRRDLWSGGRWLRPWRPKSPADVRYWLNWAVEVRYVAANPSEQDPESRDAERYSLTPEGSRIAAIPSGERGTVSAALGAARTVVAADRPAAEHEEIAAEGAAENLLAGGDGRG
jgi:hypothetical protein